MAAGAPARAAQVQGARPSRTAGGGARGALEIDSRTAGAAPQSDAHAVHRRHTSRRGAARGNGAPARAAAKAAAFGSGDRGERADARSRSLCVVPHDGRNRAPRARGAAPPCRPALRYDPDAVGCSSTAWPQAAENVGKRMVAGMNTRATYVYCVVAADKRPRLARVPPGLPDTGPVRALDVEPDLFVIVADAPLDEYGEAAIKRGLADLDWVSRAAVAHEAVVEAFGGATAVLPMKLFTIFMGDERVRAHVRRDRQRIAAMVKRVANHQEWGVRVTLDRARAADTQRSAAKTRPSRQAPPGIAYLAQKKAQRDRA